MQVICKNLQFDVSLEESLFSMDVPNRYKVKEIEPDLFGSTEGDFSEGLRVRAEVLGQGRFPDDVSVEAYLKQAGEMAAKFEALDLSDEEAAEFGGKLQKHLLFIRFFSAQSDGPWTYRGAGVRLGEAETPIFWYRPKDSETYRVIYGDLHVEDVAPEDVPKPPDPSETVDANAGYEPWSKHYFVGSQEDYWQFTGDGRVRVKAYLTLLRGPADADLMPIRLPYPSASLEALLYDRRPLTFHETGQGAYAIDLPVDAPPAGEILMVCQWHLSTADLEKAEAGHRVPASLLRSNRLKPLVCVRISVSHGPASAPGL